jgi:hypothetical protein
MYLGRMVARSEDVFPRGVMVMGVQEAGDFKAPRRADGSVPQEVDEPTGMLVWKVTGMDMRGMNQDVRDATGFRGSPEVAIRVLSDAEPSVPRPKVEGFGAVVHFDDLMVNPYLGRDKCTGEPRDKPHQCRAELKYSFRSSGMRAA